jgi:hypothetical protein
MSTIKVNSINDANGGSNAVLYGVASPPNSMGFRNRILNGGMVIDQRNAGASVAADGTFPVDRFRQNMVGGGVLTSNRSTTAPTGFTNSVLITVSTADASIAAGDYYNFNQQVEGFNVADFGFGSASAQTVTLSFWVRSSLTGTFAGCLANSAANRSYTFTYAISSANTWEQKTVTIAGDTSGTWLTDNGIGIRVVFDLGSGSDSQGTAGSWQSGFKSATSGAVKPISTLNATFYITGVQLEAGSVATPFERRDYGRELAMCQRYYEKSYDLATTAGTVSSSGAEIFRASANNPYQTIIYKVTKRATPTVTTYNTDTGASGSWRDASAPANVATSVNFQGDRSAAVDVTTTAGNRIQGHWVASAEL